MSTSPFGSSVGTASARVSRGRRRTTAPIRSRMRKKPVRVQLSADAAEHDARAWARSPPPAARNAADEGSPGTVTSSSSSSSAARHAHGQPVALERHARAGQHPLGVVAALLGLGDRGLPAGQHAGDQHARLDLGGGHRQRVVDPGQVAAVHGQRREAPVARVDARAHACAAARRSRSTGRRRIDSSPSSVHADPACPASQPGSSRSSVPELPTSSGPRCLQCRVQPDAADDQLAVGRVVHAGPERPQRVQRRLRVLGVEVVPDRDRLVAHRRRTARRGARSTCPPVA